jgi:serine/threonine protein kinase
MRDRWLEYTHPSVILGTVAYMSREQASGKLLDARSDIFSFGITLYEMLAQRRPFAGDTMPELLHAIVNTARDHLNKAASVLEKYPTPIVTWKVYRSLGQVLLQCGDRKSAESAFAESKRVVDQIASNITDEKLRNTFLNLCKPARGSGLTVAQSTTVDADTAARLYPVALTRRTAPSWRRGHQSVA